MAIRVPTLYRQLFKHRNLATMSSRDWIRGPGPYSVYTKPIKRGELDEREYRYIRLENGLQALLVSDPDVDMAAASLDVAVGHLADPADMHGLAHFCEHLLFMGTEKFPRANEYSEYLAANNGASNAYTSISNTNYYFNVATSGLEGALARFSAFFHCPLFTPACTSKELNAVDSEHKKNHQSDMWRIYQVNKHLSKPGHPWNKFGSGHRESLSDAARLLKSKGLLKEKEKESKSLGPSPIPSRIASPALSVSSTSSEAEDDGGAVGRETRRRVVEWWENQYSAERMNLCILGKESLDELTTLASTYFSPVPNRGYDPRPTVNDHPFGPDEKGTVVSIQTIMSFYAMEISFPLEWQPPLWQLKPTSYIAHLVGHEGKGSLHSYLKNKGWILDLSTGPQSLGRGFDMYRMTIRLTPEGFKNYREILLAAFNYLTLLRESNFPSYLHDETVALDGFRFRFGEKGKPDDYVSGLAAKMAKPYPIEEILATPTLTPPWSDYEDPEAGERLVREYLEAFRIENCRVVLMAKEKDYGLPEGVQWQAEPWYGTKYRVDKFDPDFVAKANGPNDIAELVIPGPNEFIPKNLEPGKKTTEPSKRPHLVRETPLSSLWYKKDDQFRFPRSYVAIDIRSHHAAESARAMVLVRLYADLVNDALTEFSYDASLAGLHYSFKGGQSGLIVTMNGYNDKMLVLAKDVFDTIKRLVVNPERLEVFKHQAKETFENWFMQQSYIIADNDCKHILTKGSFTYEEQLAEVTSITAEELQLFIAKLLSEVNVRILVNGNMYKDEAIKIAEVAEDGLGVSPLKPAELNTRALLIPDGSHAVLPVKLWNLNQPNYAIAYFVRFGSSRDPQLRVTAALLTQILREPAFNILRTREQLGYVVWCTPYALPGRNEEGMRVIIQSEKTAPFLETRIEAFFDTMKTSIEEMSAETFEEHKSAVEKKWTERPKNLSEETARFNLQIETGNLDFLRSETDAALLPSVKKEDVLALFMARVHQSSPTRAKVAVHMMSQKVRPPRVSPNASAAFEAIIRDSVEGVDPHAWQAAIGSDIPTISVFTTYWATALAHVADKDALLARIPDLAAQYPVDGDGPDPVRPEVLHITDVKDFRSKLPATDIYGPIVEWGDLPVSKF